LEEQRRQGDVDDEEIEPGESAFRQPRKAPAGEAEQDQAEKRQRKT
jgi:hypothetical protein